VGGVLCSYKHTKPATITIHKSFRHYTLHFLRVLQANTTCSFIQSCSPDDGHDDAWNVLRVNWLRINISICGI